MDKQQLMQITARCAVMFNQMVEDSKLEGKDKETYVLGLCNGLLIASRINNEVSEILKDERR